MPPEVLILRFLHDAELPSGTCIIASIYYLDVKSSRGHSSRHNKYLLSAFHQHSLCLPTTMVELPPQATVHLPATTYETTYELSISPSSQKHNRIPSLSINPRAKVFSDNHYYDLPPHHVEDIKPTKEELQEYEK